MGAVRGGRLVYHGLWRPSKRGHMQSGAPRRRTRLGRGVSRRGEWGGLGGGTTNLVQGGGGGSCAGSLGDIPTGALCREQKQPGLPAKIYLWGIKAMER